MIRIKTTGDELAKQLKKIKHNIKSGKTKTVKDLAIAGKDYARTLAPKAETGKLRQNIRYYLFPNKAIISSFAYGQRTGFPYHLWVNTNIPTVMLAGRPRSYASTKHVGTPGYFNKTYSFLKKEAPKQFKIELNKALKGGNI